MLIHADLSRPTAIPDDGMSTLPQASQICRLFGFAAALSCMGCVGTVDETGSIPSSRPTDSTARSNSSSTATTEVSAGAATPADAPYVAPSLVDGRLPARTWRLSHREYQRAVMQFTGATIDISDFETEIDNGVYPNMSVSGIVRTDLARNYYAAAEAISSQLSAAQLTSLAGGRALTAGSKNDFLQGAVRRAFRRPATPDELTSYAEIFDLGATQADPTASFRAVVRALLTSPYFLYRTEIGSDPAAGDFTLTDHEIATFLSFSLRGAPPDDALLAAADSGELRNEAARARFVRTLMESADAGDTWRRFEREWLQIHDFASIDKDTTVYPGFEDVRAAMQSEAESFLQTTAGLAANLPALLTTPLAPSGALARFYASDPSSGGQVGERIGVLALGAVTAARAKANSTSPTLRGLFVRTRFLCQELHLPADLPPDIVETQQRSMPRTIRELYELHAKEPTCAACHSLMDPIGFNFEDLDGAGRFRTRDNAVPIDTRGELRGADVGGPTANHAELANALAQSEWLRECFARQAFRFYFGEVEAGRGVPAIQSARSHLSTGTFREFVTVLLSSTTSVERIRN